MIGELSASGEGAGSLRPCRARSCISASIEVGAVDLVAGGTEVLGSADVFSAGQAVFQQPGGLRLVRIGPGSGRGCGAGFEVRADRAGVDEPDQAAGEVRLLGRAANQMASRRAVTWSTMPSRRLSAEAMPWSIRRSYRDSSGSKPSLDRDLRVHVAGRPDRPAKEIEWPGSVSA